MLEPGAVLISAIVCVSALTSINATIMVGARSNYALGRDWRGFAFLGHWDPQRGSPRNALLVQAATALILCRTSNTSGDELQALRVASSRGDVRTSVLIA